MVKLFSVMKLSCSIFIKLFTLFIVCSCHSKSFKQGQGVAVKIADSLYYYGVIKQIDGEYYKIKFGNGTDFISKQDKLLPIADLSMLNKSDTVMAVWSQTRFYFAVIEDIHPEKILVKWLDGDDSAFVSAYKIIKLEKD